MRKLLPILIVAFMCFTAVTYAGDFENVVTMRDAFSGYNITWVEGKVPQVKVSTEVVDYVFTIGSDAFTANGKNYKLSDRVIFFEDTTYIPEDILDLSKDITAYQYGILDSMQADKEELLPLVALDPNKNSKATWKDGSVKLVSWHKYPDTYKAGTDIDTSFDEIWVFTEKEIKDWAKGKSNLTTRRLEQLIGLAPQSNYTHFSVMYVNPENLFRPSADPEITDSVAEIHFRSDVDTAHRDWYNSNSIYSYSVKYPWTRLGYTYDWNTDSDEYGLSEFIIKKGSIVKVENTLTNDEFISYLKN